MATKLRLRRGLVSDLPTLAEGEPGFTTDSKEFYIGSNTGNIQMATQAIVIWKDVRAQFGVGAGAKGDGVTDDTEAFRAAMVGGGTIQVPPGVYMLNAGTPLVPENNTVFVISPLATLKIIPNNLDAYNLFDIRDKENITFSGGTIEGDRVDHTGSTGEWGMGIGIYGCKNITLRDMTIKNCWGDGIYVGKSDITYSENITIENVNSTNNRRQGLSIVAAKNVKIIGGVYSYTNGTAPQSGIDIEPNAGDTVENIIVKDASCINNTGAGLQITGMAASSIAKNISIINSKLDSNGSYGLLIDHATDVVFTKVSCNNNTYFGIYAPRDMERILFDSCDISGNGSRGISLTLSSQAKITKDIHFYNCTASDNTTSDGIQITSNDYINFPPTNITLEKCIFRNNNRGISLNMSIVGTNISVIGCTSGIEVGNANADVMPPITKRQIPYYGYTSSVARPKTDLGNEGWLFDYTIQRPIFWIKPANRWVCADGTDARGGGLTGICITYGAIAPTTGTWEVGDLRYHTYPVLNGNEGWRCIAAGTFGTLTGITGSITMDTASLVVSDATGLEIGQYITITGVTGTKKITAISGTTITIDSNADATVVNAIIQYRNPTFHPFGLIGHQPSENVKFFGAKGDGVTDDTKAIRTAITGGGRIYIPSGTYLVSADYPYFAPPNNTTIILSSDAILKVIPNSLADFKLFDLTDKENITISGGTIEGDRLEHLDTVGQGGMGIQINGSTNITIENITVKNCWGDGIYISESATNTSQDITLKNVTSTGNRRRGLGLIDGVNIRIRDCIFDSTGIGTDGIGSKCGIDILPSTGQTVENILIENTHCTNNAGSGLELLGHLGTVKDIFINNCELTTNTSYGLFFYSITSMWLTNVNCSNNSSYGLYAPKDLENIFFHNCKFNNNVGRGIGLTLSSQSKISKNIHFYDCVADGNSQHGIQILSDDYTTYPPTNMSINRSIFRTNSQGISIGTGSLKISVIDCTSGTAEGNTSADFVPFNTTKNIPYYGYISTAGRPTLDLGTDGWAFDYTLQRPIWWNSAAARWVCADGSEARTPNGGTSTICTSYGTTAPTTGDWLQGDRRINTAPTLVRNISHWTCITAGTPGVWTAHGCGNGTTAQRPSLTANDAGYLYKDTTTGTLVMWDGLAYI